MDGAGIVVRPEQALELAARLLADDRIDEASALLAQVAAGAPPGPDLWLLRAQAAARRGQWAAVLRLVGMAQASGQSCLGLHYLRHDAGVALGREAEVMAASEDAAREAPEAPEALARLAAAQYRACDMARAIALCRAALRIDPRYRPAHDILAAALLVRGEYAEGWEEYPWRFRFHGGDAPRVAPQEWGGEVLDGAALRGQLVLIGDQGLGDVIQFARYLPFVAQRCTGSDLVLACAEALHPLLAPLLGRVAPGAALVARDAPTPRCGRWLTLSQLPRLAGTRLDSIPGPHPYLHAEPAAAARWRARLDALLPGGMRRVGLVWAGNPLHQNDASRSLLLPMLAPLTECAGVALVSLQQGAAAAGLSGYAGRAPLVSLGPELADLGETAAVMAGLDLVVTIDSAPAHLAGALGVPTLLLLPFAPDWRWLLQRADSPWYPSLRLLRQPAPGAWAPVIAEAAAAIAAWDVPGRPEQTPSVPG